MPINWILWHKPYQDKGLIDYVLSCNFLFIDCNYETKLSTFILDCI